MEKKGLKWPYTLITSIVAILCMLPIFFITDNKVVYIILSMAIGTLIGLIIDEFTERKIIKDSIETNKEASKFKGIVQQWLYRLIAIIFVIICILVIDFKTNNKLLVLIVSVVALIAFILAIIVKRKEKNKGVSELKKGVQQRKNELVELIATQVWFSVLLISSLDDNILLVICGLIFGVNIISVYDYLNDKKTNKQSRII